MCLPVKPYRIEREWKYFGLSCAVTIAREGGNRCGYVRVPPGHPYHGEAYDNALGVDVHGDLTMSELEPCTEHEDGQGWWFGFDCAHAGDSPVDPHVDPATLSKDGRAMWEMMMRAYGHRTQEHYWTEDEVARECERLAVQLSYAERR